jgi:hypothetical protein
MEARQWAVVAAAVVVVHHQMAQWKKEEEKEEERRMDGQLRQRDHGSLATKKEEMEMEQLVQQMGLQGLGFLEDEEEGREH